MLLDCRSYKVATISRPALVLYGNPFYFLLELADQARSGTRCLSVLLSDMECPQLLAVSPSVYLAIYPRRQSP